MSDVDLEELRAYLEGVGRLSVLRDGGLHLWPELLEAAKARQGNLLYEGMKQVVDVWLVLRRERQAREAERKVLPERSPPAVYLPRCLRPTSLSEVAELPSLEALSSIARLVHLNGGSGANVWEALIQAVGLGTAYSAFEPTRTEYTEVRKSPAYKLADAAWVAHVLRTNGQSRDRDDPQEAP